MMCAITIHACRYWRAAAVASTRAICRIRYSRRQRREHRRACYWVSRVAAACRRGVLSCCCRSRQPGRRHLCRRVSAHARLVSWRRRRCWLYVRTLALTASAATVSLCFLAAAAEKAKKCRQARPQSRLRSGSIKLASEQDACSGSSIKEVRANSANRGSSSSCGNPSRCKPIRHIPSNM